MKMRFLLPALVVALLLVVLGVGLTLDPRKVPSPLIDKPAPAFALPVLMQPDRLFTQNDLKGQVSLVNVFASWCVACREEHAQVSSLAGEYGINVIGLNYKDDKADAIDWLEKYGNPYSIILSDLDGRVGIDWGVYGVPETFVVDSNGIIRYKHIGPITSRDVTDSILPVVYRYRDAS